MWRQEGKKEQTRDNCQISHILGFSIFFSTKRHLILATHFFSRSAVAPDAMTPLARLTDATHPPRHSRSLAHINALYLIAVWPNWWASSSAPASSSPSAPSSAAASVPSASSTRRGPGAGSSGEETRTKVGKNESLIMNVEIIE